MTVDVSKLQFYSGDPIDKIVVEDSFQIAVAAPANPLVPTIVTTTRPNTYGSKGFTTLSFSSDNLNFYDQSEIIQYFNSTSLQPFTQLSVTASCDATTVYFYILSAYTAAQTAYINYSVDTLT